ncbi:MAG: VCBS repeat-containing protein [Bacteroidales bacterium]|nr:VCBS repeat-containing protein [Bacteroidales bacterium]
MKKAALILPVLFTLFSCKSGEKGKDFLFSLLSPAVTGVDFINQLTETEEFNIIEYLYFNNGAGVAAGDINNDGLTDLYFTSSQNSNKLYLNRGNLRFEDITDKAGVGGHGTWKTGVTMADVNGDGFLDIYVCQVGNYKNLQGKNQLFINQGNLTFIEEAAAYGLDFQGFSTQAAFFDYDTDGDLDMYLLNHSVHTSRSYGMFTLRFDQDKRAGDRLFRNDGPKGQRVFTDVTLEAGIFSSQIGYGLGINICDISNDGFPDIYISNDFHENDYLYINNGNGTFSERLAEFIAHTTRSSMGNDVGDFNNDGLLDVIVLDMMPNEEKIRRQSASDDDYELYEIKKAHGYNHQFTRNNLQLNLGGGMFSEIGLLSGIYATDWSWSPLFCDVDNDGWKDLFITNGIYRRANDLDYLDFLTGGNRYFPEKDNSNVSDSVLYSRMPLYPNINFIFRNNGDLTFTNKAKEWGFTSRSYSNGSAYADLDNDGDLDLITNNINEAAYIYRNNVAEKTGNHFLSVAFKGSGLNTRGTGARVTLYCNGQIQMAEQFATRGFMSASSDVLHFGLGAAEKIDSLIVRWPDRSVQVLKDVPADQLLTFNLSDAVQPTKAAETDDSPKLFSVTQIPGLEFRHKEDAYTDFNRERLIPHSLSTEGPALAVGDVNGDGLDDVFAGGAKGQPAQLFVQNKNGSFRSVAVPLFILEQYSEDVDAALFDVDLDGDADLYIVRGGNELPVGHPLLADRLLINDGKGGFAACEKGSLPVISHNGSCIRPGDFDNDGDLDLFLGSRSVPGGYGWSPDLFLLENDGQGHFKDVTDERMKGLRNAGMVTDASWMDYDGDGDPDLVVVGEWMKVSIFSNSNGYFTDVTSTAGLAETSGWWNCIEVADLDRDGDLDMIGGNLGLNSMLKASVKEPVEMYLADFDNNGSLDQIICSYENGISYPVASLDELTGQLAVLKKSYPRYSDFGGKTARDIFGKEILEKANLKKAVMFESCVFLNNGNGIFSIGKLPTPVQFSPVRDIFVEDANHDGITDLIVIGNHYAVRPSLGRYDASYGWCLPGGADHKYTAMMPVESGYIAKGDGRRIAFVEASGKKYIITALNDGELQVFKLLK